MFCCAERERGINAGACCLFDGVTVDELVDEVTVEIGAVRVWR